MAMQTKHFHAKEAERLLRYAKQNLRKKETEGGIFLDPPTIKLHSGI
ncbi:hypothetical protein G5S_0453 [Chlamydia pecorum E58]|uniref:Uncharacterized protein n=1 Tax=Chlamydia pecorum (strain ATCC VR-628 / DSM 29919 / E58) TaxID=331635 RepID=A0AA34RD06_CHLPE|nr:hypothetical protein G5S_0453 [Chlamydia pecorum E58]